MNNVNLKRDYQAYVTDLIPATVSGEYWVTVSSEPESSMWYLYVEPWTENKETIFYHRSLWNTVWFYQVNRSAWLEHPDNSPVLLANSIDYMNYILWQTNEQLFLYKKSETDLVIKGWKFYIASQLVTISDLDTEDELEWKTLINDALNYIYIDTENLDFLITDEVNNNFFLVATVLINAGWVITNVNKDKVLHIGTIWETGPNGLQWPQGATWEQWDPWLDWSEVELRVSGGYIQWKLESSVSWNNLISVSSITGSDWIDGREIELQRSLSLQQIQWRYAPTLEEPNPSWSNLVSFNDIRWPQWAIGNDGEQIITQDVQIIYDTIVTDDIEKTVTVTKWDGSIIVYSETWISYYDSNEDLVAYEEKEWTYDNGVITYSNGDIVDGEESIINIDAWQIAYLNKVNTFEKINTFKDTVIFEWDAIFKWHLNTANTSLFNTSLGKKQRFSFSDGLTHVMDFENLKAWNNYEWFINVSWSPATLSFAGSDFTNCDTLSAVNAIGWSLTTDTVLWVWTHYFAMSTAFWAIHIAYSSTSIQIST